MLGGLSLLYGAGVFLRRLLYDAGVLTARSVDAKVVCIGNLTTGGTGKTPAVMLAAQTLRRRNQSVAILSRGYARPNGRKEVLVLNEDTDIPWTQCGDEPWMMHQALAGLSVPILVSPDRTRAAVQAAQFFNSRIIILDDGFQHRKLKRDLDIVLVNATDPFGGGWLLPLGDLREPLSSLKRAHLILLTHVDLVAPERLEEIRRELRRRNAKAPILESIHKADFLLDVRAEKKHKLAHLQGQDVCALSGLADPASFEDQLTRCGMKLAQRWRYPDHHRYTMAELASLEKLRRGLPLVTTFKDFTRLPAGWKKALQADVYVLSIKLDILKGRNIWTDSLLSLAGGKEAA
ncbi:MAG: tetraacyldisaccharide 4'-kinase [Elusimicrobiota bacterium]